MLHLPSRGAVPVSLLEDFLGAFHRRMLERMRVAGLDHPPCSDFAQNDTRESIDTVEDESSVGKPSRSVEEAKSSSSSQIGMGMQQPKHEHERDRRSCWSERSKGAEQECTGGEDAADAGTTVCTLREGNLKSVGGPLGDRDVNSRDSQLQPRCKGYTAKSEGDRVSRTPVESDNKATTLIRDPFSPDERRHLTTNTARYAHWASSSSIVHDVRQVT